MKGKLTDFINMSGFGSLTANQEPLNVIVASVKEKLEKYPIVDNKTFVGIEVEVENILKRQGFVALADRAYLWANTEDNSLRNNGREFVSIPIKGSQISYAIQALFGYFKKDKQCVGYEFTDRTSIHIHVNYRDATVEAFANTLLLYILVEPLLYEFVGGDRYKNIFCVPLKESDKLWELSRLFKMFENGGKDDYNLLYHWTKYSGLNLAPMGRYGTIEYRHLVGTDDQDKIITWINSLLMIKKYAETTSYDKLKQVLLDMNTTSAYVALLNDVFGDVFPHQQMHNVHELLEESTMFIKEIFAFDVKDYDLFFIDADTNLKNPFYAKYMASKEFYNPKVTKSVTLDYRDIEAILNAEPPQQAARGLRWALNADMQGIVTVDPAVPPPPPLRTARVAPAIDDVDF